MKCENDNCENEVPEDNENRVCAYQLDVDNPNPYYKNALTCNCCDKCRELCHRGLFEENYNHLT